MLKKFGMVTVGITAGLLAAAPLASASTDFGDVEGDFNNQCSSEAGDIANDTEGVGGLAGIGQVAGPVASGSSVNVLNCTNILNDVLNENNVGVAALLGSVSQDR